MDNNIQHTGGSGLLLSACTCILSIGSFITANVTKSDIAWALGVVSAIVAIGSGCMAMRYYYYATKKVK